MQKSICARCKKDFQIGSDFEKFLNELELPLPTKCPSCRQQQRLSWRNERTLYKRMCDGTGAQMVSVFSPDKPFKVYDNLYWYSDKWNPLSYGRDFDFNRPFFQQFRELMEAVPQLARSTNYTENCDFVNQFGWSKDCYLSFEGDHDRNCYYSNYIYDCTDTMDCLYVTDCQLCYECTDCVGSYNLKFSQDCRSSSDSWFLKNCIGCKNCFGCVNLRNKEYYMFNKQYDKESYAAALTKMPRTTLADLEKLRSEFQQFAKFPQKYVHGIQNENSTGDYLSNTQRCVECFDCQNIQDCWYLQNSRFMKKCADISVFGAQGSTEFCYQCHEIGDSVRNVCFSDQTWTGSYNIMYSKACLHGCHDLFGCIGLRRSSYCIFNKQYTKEAYEKLRSRIIEHMKATGQWGDFFPMAMSPFCYNETIAAVHFPLNREQALAHGLRWKDPDAREYKKASAALPKTIGQTPDTILNEIFSCSACGKNYRLIKQELDFYRSNGLPPPEQCHDCRHLRRMALRNPRTIYARPCMKCKVQMQTTFAPDRPDTVYCEKCYLETVD